MFSFAGRNAVRSNIHLAPKNGLDTLSSAGFVELYSPVEYSVISQSYGFGVPMRDGFGEVFSPDRSVKQAVFRVYVQVSKIVSQSSLSPSRISLSWFAVSECERSNTSQLNIPLSSRAIWSTGGISLL